MVTGRNPDIDPTRLQPWGNPHARSEGAGVDESEASKELRKEVAEEMGGEGMSYEELKDEVGIERTEDGPEGTKHLTNHPNEFVEEGTGRIVDRAGHHLATLLPHEEPPVQRMAIVDEPTEEHGPQEPMDRESSPPSGTPKIVEEAGNRGPLASGVQPPAGELEPVGNLDPGENPSDNHDPDETDFTPGDSGDDHPPPIP